MVDTFDFKKYNASQPNRPIKVVRIPSITGNQKLDETVIKHARAWICAMLYTGPKKLEFFVREGCKVMIYEKLEFEDLEDILKSMRDDKVITSVNDVYSLTLKGEFEVRKHTLLPILNLVENPEYAKEFIQKNKEICNTSFIDELVSLGPLKRESRILEYSKNNYHKIATVLSLLIKGTIDQTGGPVV